MEQEGTFTVSGEWERVNIKEQSAKISETLVRNKAQSSYLEKIKEIIKASAKREVSMEGKCATGGRLDAASALALAAQLAGESDLPNRQLATKKEEGKIIYRLAN